MTRDDFNHRKTEGERFGKRLPWWLFACMWVAGIGYSIYLVIFLFLFWEARAPILIELGVCAVLVAVLPFFDHLWKRRLHRLGLQCPSCRSWLINQKGDAVLRDGKCGDCGTEIMKVPSQASEAHRGTDIQFKIMLNAELSTLNVRPHKCGTPNG